MMRLDGIEYTPMSLNYLIQSTANHILSYRLPEEREDYSLSTEEQEAKRLASSSNVRAMPPPMFSSYDMPINYK